MHFDRLFRQPHLFPDLAVPQSTRHQPKDIALLTRKLTYPLCCRGAGIHGMLKVDLHLTTDEMSNLSIFAMDGGNHDRVDELAAVFAIVDHLDHPGRPSFNCSAKHGGMSG